MQLRRTKRTMQHRRHDLEGELPLGPQRAEEVEDDGGFGEGAEESADEGEEEEAGEEEVGCWAQSVEDYGYVGEEFAYDIECTCECSKENTSADTDEGFVRERER